MLPATSEVWKSLKYGWAALCPPLCAREHTVHVKFTSTNSAFLFAPCMLSFTIDYVACRWNQGTSAAGGMPLSPVLGPAAAVWHRPLQHHRLPRPRWGCQPVGNGLGAWAMTADEVWRHPECGYCHHRGDRGNWSTLCTSQPHRCMELIQTPFWALPLTSIPFTFFPLAIKLTTGFCRDLWVQAARHWSKFHMSLSELQQCTAVISFPKKEHKKTIVSSTFTSY